MIIRSMQRLADVAFKGVAATAIAFAGLYVSLNENSMNRSASCAAMLDRLYAEQPRVFDLDRQRDKLNHLITIYNDTCPQLSDKNVQVIMDGTLAADVQVASTSTELLPPLESILPKGTVAINSVNVQAPRTTKGWVNIGRIGGSYGEVNFDGAAPLLLSPPTSPNATPLKARWSVHLRKGNANPKLEENPAIGLIDAGECVVPSKAMELRGQIWAEVKLADC